VLRDYLTPAVIPNNAKGSIQQPRWPLTRLIAGFVVENVSGRCGEFFLVVGSPKHPQSEPDESGDQAV